MGARQVTAAVRGVDLRLTAHAIRRMQQRGIRSERLRRLLDFGRTARGPGGCDIVILGRTYAVLGADGAVVTVGHRTRRLTRT